MQNKKLFIFWIWAADLRLQASIASQSEIWAALAAEGGAISLRETGQINLKICFNFFKFLSEFIKKRNSATLVVCSCWICKFIDAFILVISFWLPFNCSRVADRLLKQPPLALRASISRADAEGRAKGGCFLKKRETVLKPLQKIRSTPNGRVRCLSFNPNRRSWVRTKKVTWWFTFTTVSPLESKGGWTIWPIWPVRVA